MKSNIFNTKVKAISFIITLIFVINLAIFTFAAESYTLDLPPTFRISETWDKDSLVMNIDNGPKLEILRGHPMGTPNSFIYLNGKTIGYYSQVDGKFNSESGFPDFRNGYPLLADTLSRANYMPSDLGNIIDNNDGRTYTPPSFYETISQHGSANDQFILGADLIGDPSLRQEIGNQRVNTIVNNLIDSNVLAIKDMFTDKRDVDLNKFISTLNQDTRNRITALRSPAPTPPKPVAPSVTVKPANAVGGTGGGGTTAIEPSSLISWSSNQQVKVGQYVYTTTKVQGVFIANDGKFYNSAGYRVTSDGNNYITGTNQPTSNIDEAEKSVISSSWGSSGLSTRFSPPKIPATTDATGESVGVPSARTLTAVAGTTSRQVAAIQVLDRGGKSIGYLGKDGYVYKTQQAANDKDTTKKVANAEKNLQSPSQSPGRYNALDSDGNLINDFKLESKFTGKTGSDIASALWGEAEKYNKRPATLPTPTEEPTQFQTDIHQVNEDLLLSEYSRLKKLLDKVSEEDKAKLRNFITTIENELNHRGITIPTASPTTPPTTSNPQLASQLTAAMQLQNLNKENEKLTSRINALQEEEGRLQIQMEQESDQNKKSELIKSINTKNEQLFPLLTTKREYGNRITELTHLKGTIDLSKLKQATRTTTNPEGTLKTETIAVYDGKDFFVLGNDGQATSLQSNDPRLYTQIQGTSLSVNLLIPDMYALTVNKDGKDTLRIADLANKGDTKSIIDYLKSQDRTVKFDGETYGRITVNGNQVYLGKDGLFASKPDNADDVYRLAFKYEEDVGGQYYDDKDGRNIIYQDANGNFYLLTKDKKTDQITTQQISGNALANAKRSALTEDKNRKDKQRMIDSRRRWAAQLNEIFYPGPGAQAIEKALENLIGKDISVFKWIGNPWSTRAFATDPNAVESLICNAKHDNPENIITPPTGTESRAGSKKGKWLDIKAKRYETATDQDSQLINWNINCPYNNNNPRWQPSKDDKGNLVPRGYLYKIQYVVQHPYTKEQIDKMDSGDRKKAGLDEKGNLIFRIVLDSKPCTDTKLTIPEEYKLAKQVLAPMEKSQAIKTVAYSGYDLALIEKVCISFDDYKPKDKSWDLNNGRKKCADVKVEKVTTPQDFIMLPKGTNTFGTSTDSLGNVNTFANQGGTPTSNADFNCPAFLAGTPDC